MQCGTMVESGCWFTTFLDPSHFLWILHCFFQPLSPVDTVGQFHPMGIDPTRVTQARSNVQKYES